MKKCMHKIENMPLQRSAVFLSLTDEPICFFFQENPLCSYILIGRMRVKSSGMVPGLANARPSGRAKFANAPPRY